MQEKIDEVEFCITIEHKRSALWQRLKPYLASELQRLREINDRSLSELETSELRGRIKQLKAIINLDRDAENES